MNATPSRVDWRARRMAWRHALLAARRRLPESERRMLDARLLDLLRVALPPLAGQDVGLYWPVRGEPDLRRLALLPRVRAALPVVVRREAPVEFHRWTPGSAMRATGFGVEVPAVRCPVRPDVVVVPLLGFDAAGYRLGYGSGCYDRTLAVLQPRPFTVGVGYESGRLADIDPQPHDVPMDLLVTESGVHRPVRRDSFN